MQIDILESLEIDKKDFTPRELAIYNAEHENSKMFIEQKTIPK